MRVNDFSLFNLRIFIVNTSPSSQAPLTGSASSLTLEQSPTTPTSSSPFMVSGCTNSPEALQSQGAAAGSTQSLVEQDEQLATSSTRLVPVQEPVVQCVPVGQWWRTFLSRWRSVRAFFVPPPTSTPPEVQFANLVEFAGSSSLFLDRAGIFRVPGNAAKVKKAMENLSAFIKKVRQDKTGVTVNVHATVLKKLVSECSEADKKTMVAQAATFSESQVLPDLDALPLRLKVILPLLGQVATNQAQNKMTPTNLAVCFAPNFIPLDCDPQTIFTTQSQLQLLVTGLIERAQQLIVDAVSSQAPATEEVAQGVTIGNPDEDKEPS